MKIESFVDDEKFDHCIDIMLGFHKNKSFEGFWRLFFNSHIILCRFHVVKVIFYFKKVGPKTQKFSFVEVMHTISESSSF